MSTPPLQMFEEWFAEAKKHPGIVDATAMALATSGADGQPSVRMVLLKHHGDDGFVFYTNLESAKAHDLRENPRAALCFHWAPLTKQIRIEGDVSPVTEDEADRYFATRPRLSQLGAWASQQSQPMPHRYALETGVAKVAARFGAGAVSRPPHWSGYRLKPARIEFWKEGAFRHHERILFSREGDRWTRTWLYP